MCLKFMLEPVLDTSPMTLPSCREENRLWIHFQAEAYTTALIACIVTAIAVSILHTLWILVNLIADCQSLFVIFFALSYDFYRRLKRLEIKKLEVHAAREPIT